MATFYIMSKDDDLLDNTFHSQFSNRGHTEPKSKKYKTEIEHNQVDSSETEIVFENENGDSYNDLDDSVSVASAKSTPESKPTPNNSDINYIPLSPARKNQNQKN